MHRVGPGAYQDCVFGTPMPGTMRLNEVGWYETISIEEDDQVCVCGAGSEIACPCGPESVPSLGVVADVRRFDIWLVTLDPTQGSETRKTRPCVVVSPDEMNRHIRTVIIAPMTSRRRDYPTRVDLTFQRTRGQVVLDQIRTVDKSRLTRKLGHLSEVRARAVAGVLVEMFSHA